MPWEKREFVVLGMTYPQYSKTCGETACTGAVFTDTLELLRLYPVPRRYLESRQQFHKFGVYQATVTPHSGDPRKESYRIDPGSIVRVKTIPSKNIQERLHFLTNPRFRFGSVEDMKTSQKTLGTSLGVIKPQSIIRCELIKSSDSDRRAWVAREKSILSQPDMFDGAPMKIDFPETEFLVHWTDCKNQPMRYKMQDWGLHELWRKLREDPKRDQKILDKMNTELDLTKREVYFFMGSFRDRLYNFGLMGYYAHKRPSQAILPGF